MTHFYIFLLKNGNDYKKGKHCVKELRVLNDTAERGVQLFQEFKKLLTNDEDDKQFLLQVFEANIKILITETTKKKSIVNIVSKK